MKFSKILILAFIIVMFANCTNSKYNEQLNNVESIMDIQPDSALSILKALDYEFIKAEEEKARYILLKTHITTKYKGKAISDSLITISADYYKKHPKNNSNLVMSLIYQSNYLINKGEFGKAMMSLLQAEELFTQINDNYIKGYHSVLLGALYAYYCDFSNASIAYQEAYKHFENCDNSVMWQTLVRLQEGIMYFNLSTSYERAISMIQDALRGAEQMKEESLITLCKGLLIIMYTETKQLNKAYQLVEDVKDKKGAELSNNIHVALYSSLSYLFYHKGDNELGNKYMNLAKEYTKIKNDNSVTFVNRLMDIAILKRNYVEAHKLALESRRIGNEKKLQLLERPLMTSQRDYFKKELEQNKEIQKIERQRNIAVIFCLLLIAMVVILYLRRLNKKKQRKLDEYADVVVELKSTLQENKTAASELIVTLYKEQFKILNGISDSFFSQNNDAKGQKYVYNEVKYLIEQFSKDKKVLLELENTVNKCCDNVMIKLREEISGLDEIDYRQLCYHYAGFSGKLISILLDKSQANIYMRKSRLKEKIQQSNAQRKDEILVYLG